MRIVAFNGSPRKNGNTARMLTTMLSNLEARGCDTKLIHIGGMEAYGCMDCGLCRSTRKYVCFQKKDRHINEWFTALVESHAVILGSPVYAGGVTPVMKAFVEKAVYLARGPMKVGAPGTVLRNKIGVAVTPTRRSGGIQTLQGMTALFAHTQMIMPCCGYWPVAFGVHPGDCEQDTDGMRILDTLTERLFSAVQRFTMPTPPTLTNKEN